MKIHFGWLVVFLLGGFVLFMLNLVFRCTGEKVELVSKDYYEQEIKYQQHIEKEKNVRMLSEPVSMDNLDNQLVLVFPSEFYRRGLAGSVIFYKPDDSSEDFKVDLDPQMTRQSFDMNGLKKGWWQIALDWTSDGKQYYQEKKILIQ